MIKKVGVAAASVMLLAGCAGSGEAGKTVTVTASEASVSSSSSSEAGAASTAAEPAASSTSSTIDCADSEDLSQAEWIDNCSEGAMEEDPGMGPVDEPEGDAGLVGSGSTISEAVKLGETYAYPDGLKVTVGNWRAGGEDYEGNPYVLYDIAFENTGSEPADISYWPSAVYGDAGKAADSFVGDEEESGDGRLQAGAKNKVTGTLGVPGVDEAAVMTVEFYDPVTFDTPRDAMLIAVNGGLK